MNTKTILKRKTLLEQRFKKLLDKLEKETSCSVSDVSFEKVTNLVHAEVEGERARLETVNEVQIKMEMEK